MAELKGEPNPAHFKQALAKFEAALKMMTELDGQLQELEKIHAEGQEVPEFARAMKTIVAEHEGLVRVSQSARRFANVAREDGKAYEFRPSKFGTDLKSIMAAQREDLRILKVQLDSTIEAYRVVLPAAEKGEFAALMLSGRAGFADRIQEAVDMVETFAQFYTRSCMTTITATMQAYPAGLQFLKDGGSTPSLPEKPDLPLTPEPEPEAERPQPQVTEEPPPPPPAQKPSSGCSSIGGAAPFGLVVFAAFAGALSRFRRRHAH